jgi:hypothetical protein
MGLRTRHLTVIFIVVLINLSQPSACVMHQQVFIIQELYILPTLYECVLYLPQNKWTFAPYDIN